MTITNGISSHDPDAQTRTDEVNNIIKSTTARMISFLRQADNEIYSHRNPSTEFSSTEASTALVNPLSLNPEQLKTSLDDTLSIGDLGSGIEGLRKIINDIFTFSVNTSCPGFLDKLYGPPLPPGIAGDLVLSVLNTNLHVYQVSPVLTLVEKKVTKSLAGLFGLNGPRSGGISVQGGSASNLTSIVVARNTLFPETKIKGNAAVEGALVLFTSAHGHYSIEKAAQALGLGSENVVPVPVDVEGRMIAKELERLIIEAKSKGQKPFYVNATAGTTVFGSFDPFTEISSIAKTHRMWFHIDGAWGGSFTFSQNSQIRRRLLGMEDADSIAINPHKMLGVPVTCSFLLGKDMQQFQSANTLRAGYLFHDSDETMDGEAAESGNLEIHESRDAFREKMQGEEEEWSEPYDLADMTLQCGRRGDSLKFFLCWKYYGTRGYGSKIDNAYNLACHMSTLVDQHPDLTPVLGYGRIPGCLQVCFYFTPGGYFFHPWHEKPWAASDSRSTHAKLSCSTLQAEKEQVGRLNSKLTSKIKQTLISRGFMIDFAPALEHQRERGSFFRVVVNISTVLETVERLLREIVNVGHEIVAEARGIASSQPRLVD